MRSSAMPKELAAAEHWCLQLADPDAAAAADSK